VNTSFVVHERSHCDWFRSGQGEGPRYDARTTEKAIRRRCDHEMGEASNLSIEAIPTGSVSLDIALGIGGIPRGRHHRDLRPGIVGQDDVGAA